MKTALLLLCVVFIAVAVETYKIEHPNSDLITEADRIKHMAAGNRIIGGSDTTIDEYPWQASLRSGGSHICGAAIIDNRWLVCAAHCTQNAASSYKIMVGSTNRLSNENVFAVQQVYNHPNYNSGQGTFPNDISLIKLTNSIDYETYIKPIGIPPSTSDDPAPGTMCTISGWGRNDTSNNALPVTLQAVEKPIMSNNDCFWGMFLTGTIIDSHICVSTPGVESACNGDSGGPLTCPSGNGGVMLAGVTSWGRSNCPENYPSVYTRISHFTDWITTTIDQNSK